MFKINTTRNDFTLNLVEDPVPIDYQHPSIQRHLTDFVARNAKIIKRVYIHSSIPTTLLQELLEMLAQHSKLREIQDRSMRILNLDNQSCLYKLHKLWVCGR